jgi:hypothetical protein
MRPYPAHNPTIETVEELADVSLTVVKTPSPDDRIDLLDQLPRAQRCFASRTASYLVFEVIDGFLSRIGIQITRDDPTADLLRREVQGATAALYLEPQKLKAMAYMDDSSLLGVQGHAQPPENPSRRTQGSLSCASIQIIDGKSGS